MSLLIGLVDQEISPHDKLSWYDNKLGGSPIWLTNSPHHDDSPHCHGCYVQMTLVVQLYCPLTNSPYHRCLYLFVCSTPGCLVMNRWRVFRSILYDETYVKPKEKTKTKDVDTDLWANDQDDWGDDDADDWGECPDDDAMGQTAAKDWGSDSDTARDSSSNERDEGVNRVGVTVMEKSSDTSSAVSCDTLTTDLECCGSGSSPCQTTSVQNDLASSLSTVSLGDQQDSVGENAEKGMAMATGDAIELGLGVSNVHSRFDQLATILKTKYKEPFSFVCPSVQEPIQLRPYFLSVVDGEQLSSSQADHTHIASLLREYERSEGKDLNDLMADRPKSGGSKSASRETYEKPDIKHGDKVFHKFLKEIQKYPQQCIRYERGGNPLLVHNLTPETTSTVPVCARCGENRVFELQLVPALIPWLHSCQGKPSEIEFGTILVFTCSLSCVSDLDLVEEYVVVQHDTDHHLYR